MNSQTLERIIPDQLNENEVTGEETLKIHIQRYEFASENLRPGQILDIACGVGYGSYIIAQNIRCVAITGVDIDTSSIEYARKRYLHPKITFLNADALQYSSEVKYDTIISLETVEHIPKPKEFIAHLKSLLNKGGYLIASVPTTPSMDANPHHLTDFTKSSFRRIFKDLGFIEVKSFSQVQKFSLIAILFKKEKRVQNVRLNLLGYYVSNPVSLIKRIYATVRYGFSNRYLTVVWKVE